MATKPRPQNPLVCHGHTRPIVELEYTPITPDGYFLASASKDGQPMLRNGETGDWIGTFQGHKVCLMIHHSSPGAVWSMKLNDPGLTAVTGSADFSARVWDALSGAELCQFPHKHIVRTVDFAHHSQRIVTGGHEKLVRVYDLGRPDAPPQQFAQAPGKVRCLVWAANDTLLLSSDIDDPNITVWDVRAHAPVRTLPTAGVVTSIELSKDGRFITTADGKEVKVWDAAKLESVKSFRTPYSVESASYCAERGRFAAGGDDMWVHLYDFATGEELEVNRGHHGPVHCVRFAPDGATYSSGSEDGTIRIWQTDYSPKTAENGDAAAVASPAPAARPAATNQPPRPEDFPALG